MNLGNFSLYYWQPKEAECTQPLINTNPTRTIKLDAVSKTSPIPGKGMTRAARSLCERRLFQNVNCSALRCLAISLAALAAVSLAHAAAPANPLSAETPGSALTQPSASPSSTGRDRETSSSPDKSDGAKWTDKLSAYSALAGAVVGAIATIAAALSAYYSLRAVRQADATERERARSAKAERFSALWSEISEWKYLSTTELSDLASPVVAETVRRNINSMGKVGFWWETHLIQHDIVAQEIAELYVRLFDQISRVGELATLKRTGQDLIQENPSARKLYKELKKHLAKPQAPSVAASQNISPETSHNET